MCMCFGTTILAMKKKQELLLDERGNTSFKTKCAATLIYCVALLDCQIYMTMKTCTVADKNTEPHWAS